MHASSDYFKVELFCNPVIDSNENGLISILIINVNESMCACLQVETVKDVLFANIFYSFDNFCEFILHVLI